MADSDGEFDYLCFGASDCEFCPSDAGMVVNSDDTDDDIDPDYLWYLQNVEAKMNPPNPKLKERLDKLFKKLKEKETEPMPNPKKRGSPSSGEVCNVEHPKKNLDRKKQKPALPPNVVPAGKAASSPNDDDVVRTPK